MTQADPRSDTADTRLHSGTGQPIRFEENDVGFTVIDRVEQCRRVLRTQTRVSPTRVAPAAVDAPVDAAMSVEVTEIACGDYCFVDVREPGGPTITSVAETANEQFPPDEYLIDLPGPIKLYIQVEGSVAIESRTETTIAFPTPTTVTIGARSHHKRPAATVTTTTAVEDIMAAISMSGSALKTTSPERAWPTMRGHPPAIELGDALEIPDGIEPPADDVRIVVPPALDAAYVAAPLSFYLGAPLEAGTPARIEAAGDTVFDLDADGGLPARTEQALEQVLLLDCLVRTEGLVQVPLHERAALESELGLTLSDLYDQPMATRLARYFEIPYAELKPSVPTWEVASYVAPEPDHAPILPYLLDDLSIIRTDPAATTTASPAPTVASSDEEPSTTAGADSSAIASFTRSTGGTSTSSSNAHARYVQVGDGSAIDEPWVGEGMPIGGSKASQVAMQNRQDRTPSDPPISVALVCNDESMADELGQVKEPYGEEEALPFEVTVYTDLSAAALATAIETAGDFFHYVGHANEEGFECRNGPLDMASVDSVAPDAFLLNACWSYDQAMALIEGGAIGGVATISPVLNPSALTAGNTLAHLLNFGFPLRTAVHVARTENSMDGEYVIVGDGGHALAQRKSTTAPIVEIQSRAQDAYKLRWVGYPAARPGFGSVFHPHLESADYYLVGNETPWFELSPEELSQIVETVRAPIKFDDALYWHPQAVLDVL